MVRKTREDALETRNRLLDAAEQVFCENGFSSSSLTDVALAANVTRGAIYWHFKNKTDLFQAMFDRVHLPLEALAEACADENEPDPLGRMRDFIVFLLKDVVRNPRRRRVLTILFHKCEFNEETGSLVLRQQAAFMDCDGRIRRVLDNAVARGQLPPDLNTQQAAIAQHAFVVGLIGNWLFMPNSFDLARQAENFADACIAMLQHHRPAARRRSAA